MRTWALLSLLALPAAAADVEETARGSFGAYLQGRHEDSASGWKYLSELGVTAHRPEANAGLAFRDAALPEQSLPFWIKAALVEGADGFIWNQKGWSQLSLGRPREAAEAFVKAIDRSSTTASQAEANLGLGLTALLDSKPKAALEPLRRAAVAGPFAIAAAAQLTAEAGLRVGDRQSALTYYRQALDVDPQNREALRALVRLLDKIGDNRGAWRAARRALAVDPKDEESRKVLARNARFVPPDADESSGVRRIGRPVLDAEASSPDMPGASTPTVRVGLYGAPDGRAATMTRAYVMANSAFKVTSPSYGTMRDDGRAFDQWEIEWRAESGAVEVRDASRNILFVAKQPFKLSPSGTRASILIKSARVADAVGVDLGDREVRGSVEVLPNPWGFKLVQEAPLELYLYGVVSLSLPDGSPPEAYKAMAVTARTAALWASGRRAENLEKTDLLDDGSVQRTIGVSGELRAAQEAVAATEGLVLADGDKIAYAPHHEDSGGITEDGAEAGAPELARLPSVHDSQSPLPPWTSPLDLERFVHENPPQGLYSEAVPGLAPAASRWVRVLLADDLRRNVERTKDIGTLRRVRVAARTPSGRVKTLEVEGSRGSISYSGAKELADFLSPGSLRSTLFTIQPLYDGRDVDRLVVWGAGTGSGLGLSRAGAAGQAGLGADFRAILSRYFPKYSIRPHDRPPAAAQPAPKGLGPYRRTLNFRKKK